jgi:TM2 domain-containing membrane protein YozV
MKIINILKSSALFFSSLILFNSCGISIDATKRYHQPGFYVNVSYDRQSIADNNQEIEMIDTESQPLKSILLSEKPFTLSHAQIASERQALDLQAAGSSVHHNRESGIAGNNLFVSADPAIVLPVSIFSGINVDANVIQTRSGGSGKSQSVALILGLVSLLLLFGFGLHRFYLGYIMTGILQLLLTLVGALLIVVFVGYFILLAVFIWTLIDVIRIITGSLKPKNGQYSSTF